MADQHNIRSLFRPGKDAFRVGLFGGTFDPVHLGHLHAADEVKEAFGLSRMIVVPAAVPPHKLLKTVSNAGDRLHMVRLCFEGRPGFDVSDVELNRTGPSYSIDTLRHFLSILDAQSELMMVIGTDAFLEIHTWRGFGQILEIVPLIVIMRPEADGLTEEQSIEAAETYLVEKVSTGYRWNGDCGCFIHHFKKPIYYFQGTPWRISSTEIRRRVKNGQNVSSWLQKEVYDYIKEKGLYA